MLCITNGNNFRCVGSNSISAADEHVAAFGSVIGCEVTLFDLPTDNLVRKIELLSPFS